MRQTIVRLLSWGMFIIALTGCSIDEPSINSGKYPFVKEGKKWITTWATYQMEGDTIIGAKSYKKLLKKRTDVERDYIAAIRQNGGQVYAIKHCEKKEVLLYDFSLEPGDKYFWPDGNDFYRIESKIPMEDGRMKMTMFLPLVLGVYYWIEGVGDLEGPFMGIGENTGIINECIEDGKHIYKNPYLDNPRYYSHFSISKAVDGRLQLQNYPENY